MQSLFDEYPHPAYSPDMSSPDYDTINKLKEPFREVRFPYFDLLNAAVSRRIRGLYFRMLLNGIQHLPERWQRVIGNRGEYIERASWKKPDVNKKIEEQNRRKEKKMQKPLRNKEYSTENYHTMTDENRWE